MDTPSDAIVRLSRLKWTALAFLAITSLTLLVSVLFGGQGIWAWVHAFAEAAIVGGLADWFAVTALFRKPLGLPIPHTAIIPRSKDRIADGLASFVQEHFLNPSVLLAKIQAFNPASRIASFMQDPEQVKHWTEIAREGLLDGVDWLDDPTIRENFVSILRDAVEKWNAANTAGQVITVLTRDGRHQVILDSVLEQIGTLLSSPKVKSWASARMVEMARSEWPKIVGMINAVKSVDGVAETMAGNLGSTLTVYLANILKDPEHALRKAFDQEVIDFTLRLQTDAKFGADIQRMKSELLQSAAVKDYIGEIFEDIKQTMRAQLMSSETPLMRKVRSAIGNLGSRLGNDPNLLNSINKHILLNAEKLVVDLQESITTHIAQTIKAWDERQIVDTLEVNIGSDLQFIRLSGTLVGGVIGMLLHAGMTFLPALAG